MHGASCAVGSLLLLVAFGCGARDRVEISDEGPLWNAMESILVPRSGLAGTDGVARYVVKTDQVLRAIEIECRGACEPIGCGLPYRPGCKPTATCERKVFEIDVALENERAAYAWLDPPA